MKMDPIIMTVASTGGKWTQHHSAYVPMSPDEIITDTEECFNAGASMAHIHARDSEGNPTDDPEIFGKIIDNIRSRCPGMIIQISTGNIKNQVESKLLPLLKLKPEMASFGMKLEKEELELTATLMNEYKVKPAVECYTHDMLSKSIALIKAGFLQPPFFFELVFDMEFQKQIFADLAEDLLSRVRLLPHGSIWSQTRGGEYQNGLQCFSILLGGHIRTGLEDNLFKRPGVKAQRSAELFEKALMILNFFDRSVADPSEARKILGFSK
jgi:3-keto-5-aminohexanoate cleavage enzyme